MVHLLVGPAGPDRLAVLIDGLAEAAGVDIDLSDAVAGGEIRGVDHYRPAIRRQLLLDVSRLRVALPDPVVYLLERVRVLAPFGQIGADGLEAGQGRLPVPQAHLDAGLQAMHGGWVVA